MRPSISGDLYFRERTITMLYKGNYLSPLGIIEIVSDENSVLGLWFENQKYFGSSYNLETIEDKESQTIIDVKKWLNQYFDGQQPNAHLLNLAPDVSDYRNRVLKVIQEVPYGKTITYKEIADEINKETSARKTSTRAVGGAVGHNPISILIPCHRVIGSGGQLTGYAGGIERKIELLALEGHSRNNLEQLHI